jgi:hypothetical protein
MRRRNPTRPNSFSPTTRFCADLKLNAAARPLLSPVSGYHRVNGSSKQDKASKNQSADPACGESSPSNASIASHQSLSIAETANEPFQPVLPVVTQPALSTPSTLLTVQDLYRSYQYSSRWIKGLGSRLRGRNALIKYLNDHVEALKTARQAPGPRKWGPRILGNTYAG